MSDGIALAEEMLALEEAALRTRKREKLGEAQVINPKSILCRLYGRHLYSRTGFLSHKRVCKLRQNQTGTPSTS